MPRAVLALMLGVALYVAFLACTPRDKLMDADYWADHRSVAAIGILMLLSLTMWTALSLPPGATLEELFKEFFRGRGISGRRHSWVPYALIGSLAFAGLSIGHLVLIDIRKRLAPPGA